MHFVMCDEVSHCVGMRGRYRATVSMHMLCRAKTMGREIDGERQKDGGREKFNDNIDSKSIPNALLFSIVTEEVGETIAKERGGEPTRAGLHAAVYAAPQRERRRSDAAHHGSVQSV